MVIWHTSHEPIFLINKYIFIRYFIVTFGAEVACKWRDPAMLRCPYFSDENLPSREFGSSSRCVATRKIMAGPPYSWWSTFWMTNLWDIHLQESWGSLIFGWKPREIQLTNRKDIGTPSFDSTIMGNPNFHGIIKGHSNFWWQKSWETDWIPSGSVLPPTIFGGFRCDQDPDSSNAAWYYANFSNYFIAAGTETCGQIGTI